MGDVLVFSGGFVGANENRDLPFIVLERDSFFLRERLVLVVF